MRSHVPTEFPVTEVPETEHLEDELLVIVTVRPLDAEYDKVCEDPFAKEAG